MRLFKETQHFSKWITVSLAVLMLVAVFPTTFMSTDEYTDNLAIKLLLSSLPIAIAVFMFVLRQETYITEDYIEMRYFPLVKKKWYWKDIMEPQVIDYGFVGGWGIRIWTGYGTVYNTKGSKGLNFKTTQKGKPKEYTIGTQRPEELQEVLQKIKNN
ncbi:MAG: hypothetical protein WBG46_08885 [Nonlabens sp.]